MLKTTPLNAVHRAAGARMVDFGGWDMPVNYGSQIEEHHAVRRDCGLFDVSHMRVVDFEGAGVRDFLRTALANDVDQAQEPRQGALFLHADRAGRGGRRPDRLLLQRGPLPHGGQRGHCRQGHGLALVAARGLERIRHDQAASRPRDHRGAGPQRPREGLERFSADARSYRGPRAVQRRDGGPVDDRPHRLHRRGWLRGGASGHRCRRLLAEARRRRSAALPASARATRCAWKPA